MVAPVDHATLSAMKSDLPGDSSRFFRNTEVGGCFPKNEAHLGLYFAILRHRGTGIDVAARSRSVALIVSHESENGVDDFCIGHSLNNLLGPLMYALSRS